MLGELAAVLRDFGELVIFEDTATLLVSMSAATIDRRPARNGAKIGSRGAAPPSRDRCSKVRFRCAPGPTGTTPDPGSLRSTSSPTTAATPPASSRSRLRSPTSPPAGPRTVRAQQGRNVRLATQGHRPQDAVPDPRGGLRQRIRIHQYPLAATVPRPRDHLHPGTAGRQELRMSRRTEELGGGQPPPVTTATTPQQKCCYSTRSGSCSPS